MNVIDELPVKQQSLLYRTFGWMTPDQRGRLARIAIEWRALKGELLELRRRDLPIEEVEPRLASPRSSLNPQHFDASFDHE